MASGWLPPGLQVRTGVYWESSAGSPAHTSEEVRGAQEGLRKLESAGELDLEDCRGGRGGGGGQGRKQGASPTSAHPLWLLGSLAMFLVEEEAAYVCSLAKKPVGKEEGRACLSVFLSPLACDQGDSLTATTFF